MDPVEPRSDIFFMASEAVLQIMSRFVQFHTFLGYPPFHLTPTNSGTDRARGWKTIDRLFCPVSLRAREGFFRNP